MDILKTIPALALRAKSDRRGVTMIEYGLLAALIALVLIATLTTLGTNLSTLFSSIASTV